MIKEINLNGKIPNYKFDEKSSVLKPFITIKKLIKKDEKTEEKFSVDTKNAINMKDSKFLEIMMDDFGLKIMDEEEKGFCITWEKLDIIRDLNDFNFKDSDTDEENDRKELKMDEFVSLVFDIVLNEVNKDK